MDAENQKSLSLRQVPKPILEHTKEKMTNFDDDEDDMDFDDLPFDLQERRDMMQEGIAWEQG